MKEVNLEKVKEAANRLLFNMTEEEYLTLVEEFKTVIRQMEIIASDKSIDQYEPMIYPFPCELTYLREDIPSEPSNREEMLKNARVKLAGQIKVNKVGA